MLSSVIQPFQYRCYTPMLLLSCVLLFSGFVRAEVSHSPIVQAAKTINSGDASLVVLYPEGSLPNIEPVAKAFTEYTGVSVSFLQTTVDDINTKMLLGAAQQVSDYDVALPATFGIPDLVEAGALLDISLYAEKYEPLVDYQPSLYELGDSYKGKRYGYQTDGDTYVMFYNKPWLQSSEEKQRFEETYNKPLATPSSWQELDELMAFFHRPEKGMYGGCMFRVPRYMVWEWWIRFHAKGAYPVNEMMQANIAGEAGVQALEEMLKATQYQHPSVSTNGLFDNWAEYAKGHCFANIGWGGTQKYLGGEKSAMQDKLVHAPTPEASYFNWGWNYVVSRYSKQPELAYLFTLFATMPDMSAVAVRENGFFDPYRLEHYTDQKIQNTYGESFLQAHQQTMKQAIPDFYLEGHGRYIQVLQETIVSAHEGYVTPQEALSYAASQWEALTDEIGRDQQINQWLELKKKYPVIAQ
jgi:multiple sugar transport system substrate-binding protein